MRILLINPGHDGAHHRHKSIHIVHRDPPPIGLLYLATSLKDAGYRVDILDTHITENWHELLVEYIQNYRPLYIGITVMIGLFQRNADEITKIIRDINPTIPVVWGGVMTTVMPEEIKAAYKPDYIITHEGESKAVYLAKKLRGDDFLIEDPPIDLNSQPVPAWEVFGNNFNKEQFPYYHMVMTSRGCPFNCSFCYKHSIPKGSGPDWRMRSADHVIKELEYMHRLSGTTVFSFGDDNFLVNKERAFKIFEYMNQRGWYAEEVVGHINNLDDELIAAMTGIVQTFIFSIETASPRLQAVVNKRIKLDEIPEKVRKLNESGIVSPVSFIIGLPTETDEDLQANWDYMEKIKAVAPWTRGNIYFWFPLPQTKLTDYTEQKLSVNLHFSVREYEASNFWVDTDDMGNGLKFHPWLSEERYKLLIEWGAKV